MNLIRLNVFGQGYYSGSTYEETLYLLEEDYNKIKEYMPASIYLSELDGKYSEQEEDVNVETILEKDLLTYNFEDKDNNDGDDLLYTIKDKLYDTEYDITEMVREARKYINSLDSTITVSYSIRKSKKAELDDFVNKLNSEK